MNWYYSAVTAERVKESISGMLGTVYNWYVGWAKASEASESFASMGFQIICISMSEAESTEEISHDCEKKPEVTEA